MKEAIVLLSGGLDSAIAVYYAQSLGYKVHALSFDYGQRHNKELQCARLIGKTAEVITHQVMRLDLSLWGGSSLTDSSKEVKAGDASRQDIPDTYVPARNMVFLSIAASMAEAIGARDIFIGVSEVDYSGYVDCRTSFIEAMEKAINQGTVCGAENSDPIHIHTPFINMTKAEEIHLGITLQVPFEQTWSCYRGDAKPCGTCDSCLLRARAFATAGIPDPTIK